MTLYLWKGQSYVRFGGLQQLTSVGSASSIHLKLDLDGDGQIDNLSVAANGNDWNAARSSLHHQARAVVWNITDGLGAVTDITYAPLTYSSVYRRDYNAPVMASGTGSQVFDITGPSYVVSYVKSSAPTFGSPGDQSIVRYRYAGLKVQAGGRGSLGFRRVSTLDLQTNVEIDTWYNQEFPLTGTARKTWTRNVGSGWSDACLTTPDSASCMVYTPVCAGGLSFECDDELPGITNTSTILKEALDEWSQISIYAIPAKNGSTGLPSPKSGPGPLPTVSTLAARSCSLRGYPLRAISTRPTVSRTRTTPHIRKPRCCRSKTTINTATPARARSPRREAARRSLRIVCSTTIISLARRLAPSSGNWAD